VAGTTFREFTQSHRLFAVERREPGEIIFRQGDPGDSAYFVRRGTVEVIDGDGSRVVATLGPGDYFGEMALLGDRPRNATVRTVSDCEFAVLGKQNFLHMVSLLPVTKEAVLATVRERAMRNSGGRGRETGGREPGAGGETGGRGAGQEAEGAVD
jgi:CRP-like cAMP-binding protein